MPSKQSDERNMEQHNKGKPVTTSVPSISIRFHANAEQLEELYGSDEEHQVSNDAALGSTTTPTNTTGTGEPESSPLKYLPRLVKRSTSIDITPTTTIDASPPSDPWRFFSDIKGKITKSVEEKITEIKSRNQEEGSPLKTRQVKDSKDNSSVSDSEDFSESSISKTCGIVSTTEGAEMSSDDDTPSIEKDKKTDSSRASSSSGLRQRFRLLKPKSSPKEGTINKNNLAQLYNINTDKIEQALPEESEIESAVDALEDSNLQTNESGNDSDVVKQLEEQFDNIRVDRDSVLTIKEISGSELKLESRSQVVFAPTGFVDLRTRPQSPKSWSFWPLFSVLLLALIHYTVYAYSSYVAGILMGIVVAFLYFHLKELLNTPLDKTAVAFRRSPDIVQVLAVQEFQPVMKYEGWMNEFPEMYNPHTYHISQTQSVYLRLQGNLLRISHTRSKVPKRALWNESKIKPTFTHHRIYNLLGAKVNLLPEGLAKKRHWSKKYPICITLNKDQMDFQSMPASSASRHKIEDEEEEKKTPTATKPKRSFGFGKKKKVHVMSQRFSKLTEENEEYEMDTDNSRASTPSPPSPDLSEEAEDEHHEKVTEVLHEDLTKEEDDEHEIVLEDDFDSLPEDWGTFTPPDESPTETKLFLFGRTDREKEDWFRRLAAATHQGASLSRTEVTNLPKEVVSDTLVNQALTETDYMKFMLHFNKVSLCSGVVYPRKGKKRRSESAESIEDHVPSAEIQWINFFTGRILFDCLRDDTFSGRVRDKIQRKLSSIKLPYFIEELLVTELSLGNTPPLIHQASKPRIDERGLWVDLDVTYEGLVVLILQTKLNLMKLKQPHSNEKFLLLRCRRCCRPIPKSETCYCAECSKNLERPAMFHSDVEDSAESSSDEEPMCFVQNPPPLDASGVPIQGLGGTSNTSKKFMKMVDRIAESKFFQAATEYRYIKKAMEGVSNTDLRLRVEIKELVGTLVLNIPAPPSDRIWIGFRPIPDLALSAQPIVGERNITFLRITSWIEKKLLQEFQKIMVIPNMEDLVVPVMSPNLPQ